ncbi:hypothetical protein LWI29_011525 [Acer saccharum]|uniref:RING-type E3 ubiquitin transferase n=1 Tax=Acer saccharum TaxID=4024 RepID=A0AA39VQK1_ACESA|nr:hypothetical protein LWI29_011525 [Acer saccharum]
MASSSSQLFLISLCFLCTLLFLHQIAIASPYDQNHNCPLSFCGDNIFPIKFPFQLTNNRSPPTSISSSRCVYPGFELSCNRVNQTILHLHHDLGPFVVQNIDYITQSLWIRDPESCFPKRLLHGLSLKDSPFVTDRLSNFTFVNCSSIISPDADYGYYKVVSCLSSENYTVLAGPTEFYNESRLPSSSCVSVSTVRIPMPWGLWFGLEVGIGLVWHRPSCGYCEELGLACGFKSNAGLETTCDKLTSSGINSRNTKYSIVLGIGIPALCFIGLACYLCSRIRAASQRRRRRLIINAELSTSSFSLPPPIIVMGLDGPTIESYPKTLLGESKRLPKPNDNTCSICLCEYQAKETLRTIPECNHYFHADCIDEWLKMKASCPVCRNLPDGSSLATPSSVSVSSPSQLWTSYASM